MKGVNKLTQLVGFFGGAFSPLHCGHIAMVLKLLEAEMVAKVIIVPATDAYKKPNLLPAVTRLECLRSVFRILPSSVNISTVDTDKPYFPHPLETAGELKRLLDPHNELVWIMGGDRLDWIAKNDNLVFMTSQYRFFVFERPPFTKEFLCLNEIIKQSIDRIVFLPPVIKMVIQ
jgi:nicotinic acid mononucleotide adenylyltransferase